MRHLVAISQMEEVERFFLRTVDMWRTQIFAQGHDMEESAMAEQLQYFLRAQLAIELEIFWTRLI